MMGSYPNYEMDEKKIYIFLKNFSKFKQKMNKKGYKYLDLLVSCAYNLKKSLVIELVDLINYFQSNINKDLELLYNFRTNFYGYYIITKKTVRDIIFEIRFRVLNKTLKSTLLSHIKKIVDFKYGNIQLIIHSGNYASSLVKNMKMYLYIGSLIKSKVYIMHKSRTFLKIDSILQKINNKNNISLELINYESFSALSSNSIDLNNKVSYKKNFLPLQFSLSRLKNKNKSYNLNDSLLMLVLEGIFIDSCSVHKEYIVSGLLSSAPLNNGKIGYSLNFFIHIHSIGYSNQLVLNIGSFYKIYKHLKTKKAESLYYFLSILLFNELKSYSELKKILFLMLIKNNKNENLFNKIENNINICLLNKSSFDLESLLDQVVSYKYINFFNVSNTSHQSKFNIYNALENNNIYRNCTDNFHSKKPCSFFKSIILLNDIDLVDLNKTIFNFHITEQNKISVFDFSNNQKLYFSNLSFIFNINLYLNYKEKLKFRELNLKLDNYINFDLFISTVKTSNKKQFSDIFYIFDKTVIKESNINNEIKSKYKKLLGIMMYSKPYLSNTKKNYLKQLYYSIRKQKYSNKNYKISNHKIFLSFLKLSYLSSKLYLHKKVKFSTFEEILSIFSRAL